MSLSFVIFVSPFYTFTRISEFCFSERIRALKVGDEVLISGIVFTGRDAQDLPASVIGDRFFA